MEGMSTETPRQRLARLMDERRADLDLTWNEVAERAGVTREGLRRTRVGSGHIRSLTKRGIERALQWSAGSVDRVLAGEEPEPAPPSGRLYNARLDVTYPPGVEVRRRGEEEDPFAQLDRLYEEWRQDPEESEVEALRAILESYRDRKTG